LTENFLKITIGDGIANIKEHRVKDHRLRIMHALEFDHAPSLSPTTRKQWHIKGHRRTRNFATLPTDYYIDLFTAFLAARTAYEAYERAYQDPSTRHSIPAEITRRVYEAGKRLDNVGGYEAMTRSEEHTSE